MKKAGLAIPPEYEYRSGLTMSTGYQGMKKLMHLDRRPTAVLMSNYEITLGAIMALRETGIHYPDEISIAAFDNLILSDIVSPRITTAVQPMEEMANKASELLLSRIQDNNPENSAAPVHIVLPARIQEYESVKKI